MRTGPTYTGIANLGCDGGNNLIRIGRANALKNNRACIIYKANRTLLLRYSNSNVAFHGGPPMASGFTIDLNNVRNLRSRIRRRYPMSV